MSWFYAVDYLAYLWDFLNIFAHIRRPHYITEEDNSRHILPSGHPLMTGYRLLVTSTVFILGMTKSVLVYGNRQTEASTVECIFGVLVVTGCVACTMCVQSHLCPSVYIGSDSMKPAQFKYILLYFTSTTQPEYSIVRNFGSICDSQLTESSNVSLVLTTGSNVVWFLLHLIGMCLAAGYIYACAYVCYTTDWSTPSSPPFIGFMPKVLFTTITLVISSGNLLCIFLLLRNLYKHSEPFRVSRSGRYLAQFPGLVIFKRIHEKYWLPTPPPSHRRGRLFYLKRVLVRQCSSLNLLPHHISNNPTVIKLPINLLFLFLISVALVICAWLIAQWVALLMASMDYLLLVVWLFSSVLVVPFAIFGFCLLYASIVHFLADVRRDAVEDFDSNGLPV